MCACIYVYLYTYIHLYIYIYTHTHIYIICKTVHKQPRHKRHSRHQSRKHVHKLPGAIYTHAHMLAQTRISTNVYRHMYTNYMEPWIHPKHMYKCMNLHPNRRIHTDIYNIHVHKLPGAMDPSSVHVKKLKPYSKITSERIRKHSRDISSCGCKKQHEKQLHKRP